MNWRRMGYLLKMLIVKIRYVYQAAVVFNRYLPSYDRASNEMPSVIGMGLKEAIYLLESKGLTVAFSGRGWVESQSIPAGTKIGRGMTIILRLGCSPIDRNPSLRRED